jgi:hypothetical protein
MSEGAIVMLKLKTHFKQVSLEMVKQIVEKELQRQIATEQARGTKKKKLEEDLLEASTVNG